MTVGGVVLCGGRSRRMGTPKAWLPCGSEYLLQRMVRIVGGVAQPVVVAARRGQALPTLPDAVVLVYDAVENKGPLAGLAAGFEALADKCEAAFVTSCDHPLLKPHFVKRLIEVLGDHAGLVPMHEEHIHPLTAVYRLNTRNVLNELLTQDDLRVRNFVDRCGANIIPASELEEADPELDSLRNVNDPDTYDRVIRSLGE